MNVSNEEIPNSEILLIYEAKLCNPNGDPDAENKPRIDERTGINLISDVRLKRFFRDYLIDRFGEEYIYVTTVEGTHKRAEERFEKLFEEDKELKDLMQKLRSKTRKISNEELKRLSIELPKRCIDARLFGAILPIGGEEGRGESIAFTGPVQFSWGFSFHPVELVESSSITSIFSGREEAERYGTIGKDWRVYYSLIGFYGVVSGRRAKRTLMTQNDLKILDNLLWKALIIQPTTRSKIGEKPHLYLRVEYKDADTLIGDFRSYIKADYNAIVRKFEDVKLDFSNLLKVLEDNRENISKIYINCSEAMAFLKEELQNNFKGMVGSLPHEISDNEIKSSLRLK